MTCFLLDINLLLALMDPAHVMHDAAHAWFQRTGRKEWATCPLTQNGVIRIASQPSYPSSPGGPSSVAALPGLFVGHPGHRPWPDDVSILDAARASWNLISSSSADR